MKHKEDAHNPVLYIHLGPGKTGTTAIQKFLFDNRSRLLCHGICYPDFNHPSAPRLKEPFKLASHMFAWNLGFGDQKAKEETTFIENSWWKSRLAANCPTVVFSSEFFCGRPSQEKIDRLQETAARLGFPKVKYIYYFRRPDLLVESRYQQAVKKRGQYQPILWNKNESHRIHSAFKMYVENVGTENMIVRVFEKGQFFGGDIFRDFLHAIGRDWSDEYLLPNDKETNVGWHKDLILIMRLANQYLTEPHQIDWIRRYCIIMFRTLYEGRKEGYGMLTEDQRKQILSHYDPFHKKIAKTYLGRPDGKLFYEPILSSNPQAGSNGTISPEKAGAILDFLQKKDQKALALLKKAASLGMNSEEEEIRQVSKTLCSLF